ncbi:MAG: pyridoxamine 5'-phosphate oxidase family protein [Chloroflexi bacterium]|nr:pyridoxamine 5'-phosphate oxidase family protein [Chloroflexota bacterium]
MDPVKEIVAERERARGLSDPNANVCFLATVTPEGGATVRALSLRDIDRRGFGLLINELSPKWRQLHTGAGFELLLFWPTVHRQYRVRGPLAPMDDADLERYWSYKSHGSRLLELYYPTFEPQSTPVPSRQHLLDGIESMRRKFPSPEDVLLPKSLKGVYLVPDRIEVWHGEAERLHDRRLYTRKDRGWEVQILVP